MAHCNMTFAHTVKIVVLPQGSGFLWRLMEGFACVDEGHEPNKRLAVRAARAAKRSYLELIA